MAVCVLRVIIKDCEPPGVNANKSPARKKRKLGGIKGFLTGPNGGAPAAGVEDQIENLLADGGNQCYYLLVQRPEKGLLAGLWECPGGSGGAEKGERVVLSGGADQESLDAVLPCHQVVHCQHCAGDAWLRTAVAAI